MDNECPGENTITALFEGTLRDEGEAVGLEAHLAGCPDCLRLFARLATIFAPAP